MTPKRGFSGCRPGNRFEMLGMEEVHWAWRWFMAEYWTAILGQVYLWKRGHLNYSIHMYAHLRFMGSSLKIAFLFRYSERMAPIVQTEQIT
jgi:hypothetical protein